MHSGVVIAAVQGTSGLPTDMHVAGYTKQLCIDSSSEAIQLMKQTSVDTVGLDFAVMDATALGLPDSCIDLVRA